MLMGMSQFDLAILLPACAAAWNLVCGKTPFAVDEASGHIYQSPDGSFAVEAPIGWKHRRQAGSNEVIFLNGNVSVSVATAETNADDTIDQFLEFNKTLLRYMCPAAEVRTEGQIAIAGAPGAYFTMECPGPRKRTIVQIAVALIRKKLYIFKAAAPSEELYVVQAAIDRMAQSLRAGNGMPVGREMLKQAC
jgi:hypothetical protein